MENIATRSLGQLGMLQNLHRRLIFIKYNLLFNPKDQSGFRDQSKARVTSCRKVSLQSWFEVHKFILMFELIWTAN